MSQGNPAPYGKSDQMSSLTNDLSLHSSSSVTTATTADIRNASTLAEVRAALSSLHAQETSLIRRLETVHSSPADLAEDLRRLDHLLPGLGSQVIVIRAIAKDKLLGPASKTERLSNKVKELDLEKSRVEETLKVVEQVMELKACVDGVVGSMGAPQDWETAAGYISRAAKISENIIQGNFATGVVSSIEVPAPPWETLETRRIAYADFSCGSLSAQRGTKMK